MNITDVATVDPTFKAYRRTITLAYSIEREAAYHQKVHPHAYSPAHAKAAEAALASLNALNSALRLDSTELNSHTLGEPLLRLPVRSILDSIFLGLPAPGRAQYTDLEQAVIDGMNTAGRQARAYAHQSRLAWEIAYRTKQGWFGVFNTLTVAPGNYHKVFSKRSRAFQDYIRKMDRIFAQAAYGSIRNAKGKEYHTYFAVVEEGAKHGRLHIHVVHMFKALPPQCLDPNRALSRPARRELTGLKTHWPYGFSSPIMVRYSPQDAYGRKGFRWPIDSRTNAPLVIKSPLHLAGYLSKYITKSYHSKKRSELLWRIRKSQRLGQHVLTELLSTLTLPQLLAVASCRSLHPKLNNSRIPTRQLTQAALRTYNLRAASSKTPVSSLAEMGALIEPIPSLLTSLRGSTRTTQINSLQNATDTLTRIIKDADAFEQARGALKRAAKLINERYFHKGYTYGTTSSADHIYAAAPAYAEAG